jgi:preprotein translocase subunit YajC
MLRGKMAKGGELKAGDKVELQNGMKAKVIKLKNRFIVVETNKEYGSDIMTVYKKDVIKMAMGGETKFKDKVQSIKASLLKRKKVSPSVQKDYGKTYSPKEAKESAQRIAGSMVSKMKEKVAKRKKK